MEKVKLYENERVDSLLAEDLQIIQSADVFSFSLDAVLLADFVKPVNRPESGWPVCGKWGSRIIYQ